MKAAIRKSTAAPYITRTAGFAAATSAALRERLPGAITARPSLKPAVRMMYGAALMFFAAAFVEAFWSPLTEIPYDWKIGVGIGAWVVLLAYFLLAGRTRAAR